MKKLIILGLLLIMFAGCDVNPSKMTDKYAKDLATKLTYTYDERTNLCFAVITSRKTGNTDQTGLGMTEVPCENVWHLIDGVEQSDPGKTE